jgi:hypothetical protein
MKEQNPLTEIYIEARKREALFLKKIIPVTDFFFYPLPNPSFGRTITCEKVTSVSM